MITRCPSCHTHFRVRAEQLAARGGQVRCGKCGQVFDALEHLIEEIAPAQEHAPVRGLGVAAVLPLESAPAQALEANAKEPEPAITGSADIVAKDMDAGAGIATAAVPEPAAAPPVRVDAAAAPGTSAFEFGPIAASAPVEPVRRWPWLLGALLLLLALFAQAAYHYRSAIIVLVPEAKPYAVALCATLGCELPLPRRIELMSIEASDLQADTTNSDVMVLTATLKNRAIFEQQLPSLELTLTDAQDQQVVRRVLAPQDYIGKAANAQAGFAANSEIAIKVFIEGSQVKATGYRLYLFYP